MSGTFAFIEKEVNQNGTVMAVKNYRKHSGHALIQHYQQELKAFRQLGITEVEEAKAKNIVYLIDLRETSQCYQLLLPFYDQTLARVAKEWCKHSRRHLAYDFIRQVGNGIAFLQEKDLVHCDLSPQNILLDSRGRMYISDFGCSQTKDHTIAPNAELGTRWYTAPEHLFGYKVYAFTSDIWSFGAIFAELLLGKPLFAGDGDLEQIGIVTRALGKPSEDVKKELEIYPDFNKLHFFTVDDLSSDEEEISDDERPCFKSLTEMLVDAGFLDQDRCLVTSMLTLSRKNRATLNEILFT
ncbi:kinase-like domain-containing protein [Sporodiniella umbellata]|nr:kinase-like domain-containing protein [Sporodiniella umbellata]